MCGFDTFLPKFMHRVEVIYFVSHSIFKYSDDTIIHFANVSTSFTANDMTIPKLLVQ